jgi:uncharacterized protein (TIGR04255 family)
MQTMSPWERFPNAPISEAILDIDVQFASPVEQDRLESFHDLVREGYPIKHTRTKWQGAIEVGQAGISQAVRQRPQGFLFRSADERRVVQVRQDGFTFNWLRRYENWEALRDAARSHWEKYRDTFRPEAVTRLALKYVNRIEIPIPFRDFREYVKTAPDIAEGLSQGVSALFMRLEIPDERRGLLAVITETLQRPVDEGKRLPFIFDIEVVRRATFEANNPDIWSTFEDMRAYKNEIFFTSVTDRAKELFR